jgi:signal transduction histidine kinase
MVEKDLPQLSQYDYSFEQMIILCLYSNSWLDEVYSSLHVEKRLVIVTIIIILIIITIITALSANNNNKIIGRN